MNVRQAIADDAEKILDFLGTFWADGCDTVIHRSSLPNLQQEMDWLSKRTGEDAIVFVAELNGKIVGIIEATIPNAAEFRHTCEFGMSVLLPFRKQGIGKKLIQRLLDWAEERCLFIIDLNVFSNNRSAIALYSSMGFVEDGRRENAVGLKDGTFCDLVHMSKYTKSTIKALQRTLKIGAVEL
jgi:RimJ/RimL family protein N-acetyltransferase